MRKKSLTALPAVATIIASAKKYLKCLADYGSAGFDGYQSYDHDARRTVAKWQGIDQRWSYLVALVFDYPLHYINPPPSYTESTQRLRTSGQPCTKDAARASIWQS